MAASCSTLLAIHSGLSCWSDYFNPDERLRRPGYSTGRIAVPRCGIMAEVGEGGYWDNVDRPVGSTADAFVEHFWAWADLGRGNDVDRQIAVYVVRA